MLYRSAMHTLMCRRRDASSIVVPRLETCTAQVRAMQPYLWLSRVAVICTLPDTGLRTAGACGYP